MAEQSNVVVDLSHHNTINSLVSLKNAGVLAIIHKSTEGTTFTDDTYQARRAAAKAAGFLWGAYHFVSNEAPERQLDFFLENTRPAADELIAIDYEPSSAGMPDMTLDQLLELVELTGQRTGRLPVIYGGHLLREALGTTRNALLGRCPLWYARYAPTPIGVPPTWAAPTLWQYTDGKLGNDPKGVAGVSGQVDRNIYFGSTADLVAQWPLNPQADVQAVA
jgi:lysozyme